LKEKSGYDYSEMLFFDDDYYLNIKDSISIGVTSVLVKKGFSSKHVENGLKTYAEGKLH
jgi:Acid Phosphatase